MQQLFAGERRDRSDAGPGSLGSFRDAHFAVVRELDAELRSLCSMTLADFDVLSALAAADRQRLRMAELADTVRLTPSGLTRRMDTLSKAGSVRRERCGDGDRRGVFAVLTDDGHRRVADAVAVYERAEGRFRRDVVTREAAAAFDRVLARAVGGM